MSSILIKNAYIVSMVTPVSKADVLIEDGVITNIGNIEGKADKVIDATGKVLMPGLINSHSHIATSLFRGYNDEHLREDWRKNTIEPIEKKMTKEDVYNAAMLSMVEMIKSGTTTFNDMYFYEDEIAKAVEKTGMRAMLSDVIKGENEQADKEIAEAEKLYNDWNGKADGRIKVCVGLDSVITCPPATITKASQLALKLNTPIHMHYLESKEEIKHVRENYQKSVTDYLKEAELFRNKTILAHGVWTDELDVSELITHNTAIVNNPISNCKQGSGIADLRFVIESGITVSMGTDGQDTSNTIDMFDEIRDSAYSQKVLYKDPTAISAEYVLKMATLNGAKALGLDDIIGSIEVGKKADLILINVQKPNLLPIHNIYSTLAYSVDGLDVVTSIVDGKIIMEDRKLLTINEQEVLDKVFESVNRLFTDD